MDNNARKIRDEARQTIADAKADLALRPFDPLARWREQAEVFAQEAEQGQRELREEERRRAETPTAWDQWFQDELRRHLMDHVQPHFDGIAEGVCTLVAELRHRLDACDKIIGQQRDQIHSLQVEIQKLAIKLAELRTDTVISQMPGLGTSRGAVN
jgi:hypothetical protein